MSLAAIALFFKRPKQSLKKMTTKQKILEIDLLGALFLICAIVCLLLALQWGGSIYPWRDSKVWGCLLGFGLLISIFIAQQFRRGDRATIPPRIFGQRTVLCACLYSCFMSMGLYTHVNPPQPLPVHLYCANSSLRFSTCPFTSKPSKAPQPKAPASAQSPT